MLNIYTTPETCYVPALSALRRGSRRGRVLSRSGVRTRDLEQLAKVLLVLRRQLVDEHRLRLDERLERVVAEGWLPRARDAT